MKEIQRRAEYVCQALYFFGKIFAVYGLMLFIKAMLFQELPAFLPLFFLRLPEQAPPPYPRAARHKR